MSDPAEDPRLDLLRAFEDRWVAHRIIFRHRHPLESSEFHRELVEDFWSDDPYSIRMAFRGSGKSTLGEEDITLAACYRCWHNILVIGASETRAAERIAPIAYELANNDFIAKLFGEQKGTIWTQTKIVTAHNVCIQAIGRDQEIRGLKHMDWRPELVFVDDFEDADNVLTPEGRVKTLRRFLAEILPACAPYARVRVRATPMGDESVPIRLHREAGWPSKTYPIEYQDESGERRSSWPAAFPLSWIDDKREIYRRLGELGVWEREFMCQARGDSERTFAKEMIRVRPRERQWQPCYAMIDPARTVRASSASTGFAVWSWIGERLVVWAADAQMLLPNEIVALGFDIAERYDPIWLGAEEDGLNEFLLQPFRHEMVRRGTMIPLKAVRAPRGKLDFIRGLQPFFEAREVEFAQELPALTEQMLNFPTGRIDAPNALAYALLMRPGLPIHDNFSAEVHVVEAPEVERGLPLFLAANATGAVTAAALVQADGEQLSVLADWVLEGAPAENVAQIQAQASLLGDTAETVRVKDRPAAWAEMLKGPMPDRLVTRRIAPSWVVPPIHGDKYGNVGLIQAVKRLPAEVRTGGQGIDGQLYLRDRLARLERGLPAVAIAASAHWTLRALAGGYTRAMIRGHLQDHAEEGPYRVLMEGLESFLGTLRAGVAKNADEEEDAAHYAYDRQGRRYLSAMPARNR